MRNTVEYRKYINGFKGNRTEFLLCNFDYRDGNDYLTGLFSELFDFEITERSDGIWFYVVKIRLGTCVYELLWHEDVGNCIYCAEQSEQNNVLLEERLNKVLEELNRRIEEHERGAQ